MIVTLLSFTLLFAPIASAAEPVCMSTTTDKTPAVQVEKAQKIWLSWNNRLRRRLKLQPYTLNPYLTATAMEWAALSVPKGGIDHKRTPEASYYDYAAIEQWFLDRGLAFKNVNRITFTENIGWNTWNCSSDDCTRELVRAMQQTYRFFLSERGKASRPHWNSLVNPEFKEIGIGFAVDPIKKQVYIAIHYGTEITSQRPPMCAQ